MVKQGWFFCKKSNLGVPEPINRYQHTAIVRGIELSYHPYHSAFSGLEPGLTPRLDIEISFLDALFHIVLIMFGGVGFVSTWR
jgi:hypothetical protein